MDYYFIYSLADGSEIMRGSGDVSIQRPPAGFGVVEVPRGVWEAGLSTAPLDALQGALWQRVKAARDAAIDGGAATPEGVVDSDALSRSNISGAALGALIAQSAGAPFSVEWTLKDNSVVTLDASAMIALGLAVLAHVNGCHDHARTLREQIEAAADVTALLTIDVAAGWPG